MLAVASRGATAGSLRARRRARRPTCITRISPEGTFRRRRRSTRPCGRRSARRCAHPLSSPASARPDSSGHVAQGRARCERRLRAAARRPEAHAAGPGRSSVPGRCFDNQVATRSDIEGRAANFRIPQKADNTGFCCTRRYSHRLLASEAVLTASRIRALSTTLPSAVSDEGWRRSPTQSGAEREHEAAAPSTTSTATPVPRATSSPRRCSRWPARWPAAMPAAASRSTTSCRSPASGS